MDPKVEKTAKDILAEAEKNVETKGKGKANLEVSDIDSIKKIVADGYKSDFLIKIATDKPTQMLIYNNKIYDFEIDKATINTLKLYLKNNGTMPGSAIELFTAEPMNIASMQVWFQPKIIDGMLLLGNNSVAIYRSGLQLPSIIKCADADSARKLYEQLTQSTKGI